MGKPRGLDKDLVLSLADGCWTREHLNCLITGPAGVGKTWLACALAHSACRNGYSASYRRLPRLLTELAIARADGRYPKLLASIAKTEVLIIDDWGLAKLNAENRRDLLEIIEDRYGIRSTVVTSQLPDPRPARAQCLPDQPQGRIDAKTTTSVDPEQPPRLIIPLPSRFAPTGVQFDRNRCPASHRNR